MHVYFIGGGDAYALAPHLRDGGYAAEADGYYLKTTAPIEVVRELAVQQA